MRIPLTAFDYLDALTTGLAIVGIFALLGPPFPVEWWIVVAATCGGLLIKILTAGKLLRLEEIAEHERVREQE